MRQSTDSSSSLARYSFVLTNSNVIPALITHGSWIRMANDCSFGPKRTRVKMRPLAIDQTSSESEL